MKTFELAETFRAIVAADSAFAGITLHTGQSAAELTYPAIIFEVEAKAIGGSANFLVFELKMEVYGSGDFAPAEHAARVELLRRKFYGATQAASAAARDAIKSAVDTGGAFTLLGRGHDCPPDTAAGGHDGNHFKSDVRIAGSVRVLNPVP